tara:strand:- start:158 stop:637 length:480 start_codon:yes stop_codon:yes gene_type:complete
MSGAIPFIGPTVSLIQAKNATEIGEFNQTVFNRNAVVAEQEAERIKQKTAYDIAQFDRKFALLQSSTKTRILKSGAELSGTALNILRSNAEEAEKQKNVIEYNSKVEESRKLEEANFARIEGTMARNRARMKALGYIASAGSSLLTNFGNPYGGGNTNA